MSVGGKEVLIKATAQAIPTYAMSDFKIAKSICKGITDAMSQFWWGDEGNQKRMHWFAWWKLCIPNKHAGMGFRDIHRFNLALLAKQAWRLLDHPESFCASILRPKYFPDGNLLNSQLKKGASFTWQTVMAGVRTLKLGAIWRIGDGSRVDIWNDPWVPGCVSRKVLTPRGQNILTKVSNLIDPVTGNWDEQLIDQTFWQVDKQRILCIPLSENVEEDFVAWNLEKPFRFSV